MATDATPSAHPGAPRGRAAADAVGRRPDGAPERHWLPAAAARGLALFIGAFTLTNVITSWRRESVDFNIWWVSLPAVGRTLNTVLLGALGIVLVAYVVAPRGRPWRRWTTAVLAVAFAAVAGWNGIGFYRAWWDGEIRPGVPLPLSFVLCVLLLFVAWAASRPAARRRRAWAAVVLLATVAACVLVFPLAQVFFFGTTDYRRPAPLAVVFGAQVHNDGRPSTSLRDRMDTGVQLYKQGLARRLLVSGAVGDSGYDEAEVMRDMAVAAGVPREDVIVDSGGVNTEATVRNSLSYLEPGAGAQALAVSQFYHLPRIKLAYQAVAARVATVPALTSTPIPQTPYLVVREIAAFWVYYLRAVRG